MECGVIHDRDFNASKNLEYVAASSTETQNACGEISSGVVAIPRETDFVEAGKRQRYTRYKQITEGIDTKLAFITYNTELHSSSKPILEHPEFQKLLAVMTQPVDDPVLAYNHWIKWSNNFRHIN